MSHWVLLPVLYYSYSDCLEHYAGGDKNDIANAITLHFFNNLKPSVQEIISGHHHLNQHCFKNFTINLEVVLLLRQYLID